MGNNKIKFIVCLCCMFLLSSFAIFFTMPKSKVVSTFAICLGIYLGAGIKFYKLIKEFSSNK